MNHPHLSDRMPDVARGGAGWTAAETAHLESCPECGHEWQLIRAVADSGGAAEPLDLDRIAAGVIAATIGPDGATVPIPIHRRHWLRYSLVGLAAAAALVVVLRLTSEPGHEPGSGSDQIAIGILPELDQLTAAELNGVLTEYDDASALDQPLGEIPRLGELTDDELGELLSEVGG